MEEIIINDLNAELSDLLKQAKAPVSGRRIAYIIETKKRRYSGVNHEWENPIYFAHAEEKALEKMKKEGDFSKIKGVYGAGEGQPKIRQITPCDNCFNILVPFVSNDTRFLFFEPDDLSYFVNVSGKEMKDAYSRLDYSKIESENIEDIVDELKEKTKLVGKDVSFVADIRRLGIESNASFFLTGSSSGKGGIGQLIKEKQNKSYSDIDIVGVSDSKEKLFEEFEKLVNGYYPDLKKQPMKIRPFQTDYKVDIHSYLKKENKKPKLELTVDEKKSRAFLRKDYLYKNWYHQLS